MIRLLHLLMVLAISFGCEEESTVSSDWLSVEQEILALINEHRMSIDLVPLIHCPDCKEESLKHSENMANGEVPFGHDGFDDRFERISSSVNATNAAENVAEGYNTAEKVVEGWLNSQGHKENIEGNYTHLGTGIAKSPSGTIYYTQIFIKI